MLRMNLNIAIVSMVRPITVKDGLKSEYYSNHSLLQNTSYLTDSNTDNVSTYYFHKYALGIVQRRYIVIFEMCCRCDNIQLLSYISNFKLKIQSDTKN